MTVGRVVCGPSMATANPEKDRIAPVAIRDFRPEDYPALVAINNASFPDHPETEGEWRYEDEHFDRATYVQRRLVAVDRAAGDPVGFSDYSHMPWSFDPRRFQAWINVHPNAQRRGVGGALHDRLLEEMRERKATAVKTSVRESMTDSVAWVQRRGFREVSRHWESRLDLQAFDPATFAKYANVPKGLRIVTLKDELAEDPDRLRGVYEMGNAIGPDVPRTDPYTAPSFEMWRDMVLGPWSFPEAFFLGKDADLYVGQSDLARSESQPDVLYTGFTGVRREYRGRGVAWALKLAALSLAKARGYGEVRTWNSTLNAPMLGINVKLGFVKQPAWIQFEKDLTGGAG